jgi:uncharacterized phage-associated protein
MASGSDNGIRIEYNEGKFAELLLYLALRSASDPGFGAVKLHKLVYYSEFGAFRHLGRPITGVPFQNLEHGPAAKRLLPVQTALLRDGFATIHRVPTPAGVQKRLVASREPDLSDFDSSELAIIDSVIERLWGESAVSVSAESHEEPGWIVTSQGEEIPYQMALISRPEPGPADVAYALELIESGAAPDRRERPI